MEVNLFYQLQEKYKKMISCIKSHFQLFQNIIFVKLYQLISVSNVTD